MPQALFRRPALAAFAGALTIAFSAPLVKLAEVAREHGVEESTLDEALDLRKIAAGSEA